MVEKDYTLYGTLIFKPKYPRNPVIDLHLEKQIY